MLRSAETYLHVPHRRYFSALEIHAAAVGTVAAIVLLIGYGFNVEALQVFIPGFPAMRPRTAATFMLLSISLLLSLRPGRAAQVMSSLIAAGTIVWILEAVINNWGRDANGESVLAPIQWTLLSVIFVAFAILLINLAPRLRLVAGMLALIAVTPALFRIFTLLVFWGAPLQKGSLLSSMGIHTAILIVWFMGVCILMHPRLGFGAATLQTSLRGRLLRRALPFVLLVPVGAAVVGLQLSLTFGWTEEALFAITATVAVALAAGLIWWLSQLVEDWQKEANAQAARLARANETLEQYASSAAHDLRAPARHVMLYGELLDEALTGGDMDAARKAARSIRESALELPKIIDGMLDYSRSAYTRITLGEHSLSELVQGAIAQLASDLHAASGSVRVLSEARLNCDSTLLTSVFQNLTANAIKSRHRDRPLEIKINAESVEGFWRISVEDNGIGFDPEFAPVAFNPLARGINTAGDGAGIGLGTCRNIVQSHGGEIRIDPTFRGGARIVFTLPQSPQAKT